MDTEQHWQGLHIHEFVCGNGVWGVRLKFRRLDGTWAHIDLPASALGPAGDFLSPLLEAGMPMIDMDWWAYETEGYMLRCLRRALWKNATGAYNRPVNTHPEYREWRGGYLLDSPSTAKVTRFVYTNNA